MKQCIKCGAVQDDSHLRCNYPNCGGELKEFTTREQALEWWESSLGFISQRKFASFYFNRNPDSLTESEIEEIWEKETQPIERGITINNVEIKVSFSMLNDCLYSALPENLTISEWNNIKLFFKLLAEKPTFAQLARKELNKLNQ